jgi:hypothetical protein
MKMKTGILPRLSILIMLVATFCSKANADTVQINLPTVSTYPTISAAYIAAANDATIMLQETTFDERLSFGAAKKVLLKGGYNPDFTPNAGNSIVRGTLKISGGTAQVQNIVIRYTGTVPGAPSGVTATAGTASNTVSVSIGATHDGGSPITGYTVTGYAFPGYTATSITASGTSSPIIATCPTTCNGLAFSVFATNAVGSGSSSALTDVITSYNIVETFDEPSYDFKDTIFVGSFTLNSTTGTVSNLHGIMSESMTGDDVAYPNDNMTWLPLLNQLSSLPATLGGVDGQLVTTFMLPTTNTFTDIPDFGGTDGWSPGSGNSLYYGFPTAPNPLAGGVGNAYAMIFVNTANPTAPLTQTQIDKLAYADCAPGGMMGVTCMTGTTVEGYGMLGSMWGYPVSQIITKQ